MVVLDYTTRIPPATLAAAGVTDVLRYICFRPVGNWKNITANEYRELLDAGIGVTLNWEYDARDWNHGENVGWTHGTEAVKQAMVLGYPKGCTIFGSADYDMPATDWNARGQHYARGFARAVRAAGYEAGVYGPADVLGWAAHVGYNRFWQAGMSKAWSQGRNSVLWQGAHLRQRRQGLVGGVEVDINDALVPDWGQARKGNAAMATDTQGNNFGSLGMPGSRSDFYKTRGPSVILDDLHAQEFEGVSAYDGHSKSRRTQLLEDIHTAVSTPAAIGLLPGDRELLNGLLLSLTGAEVITPADRERIDRHSAALEAFTALFRPGQ